MRMLLSVVIALAAVVRFAFGGEGVPLPSGDLTSILYRTFTEWGMPGAIIACLLWDRKEERKKREDDGKRWYDLDQKLVGLVEKCAQHITENTRLLIELRRDIRGKSGDPGGRDPDSERLK